MNLQIHIFCTAPFALFGFQPRDKTVGTCTEILVWHGINVTSCGCLHMAESLVVEQQCCPSLFCLVLDAEVLTNTVLISDFPNMRLVFCAKCLEHTEFHHIVEIVQHRDIVGNLIIIVQATNLGVVLLQDFKVIEVYQVISVDGFPNFFVSVVCVIVDFECAVRHQPPYPFFLWNIKHDSPTLGAAGESSYVLSGRDCFAGENLIAEKMRLVF